MKTNEILKGAPTLSNEMYDNVMKTHRALQKGLASWFEQKEQVEMKILSENSAVFSIEFNHWLRPEAITDVAKAAEEIVREAKIKGEVFKVDVDGTGEGYVEALLSGLRNGMLPVNVQAFFPDFTIIVTWKNIVSRNGKR